MKQLPLSNGDFALVDDEDFERLSRFSWRLKRRSKKSKSTKDYVVRNARSGEWKSPQRIPLHREVLGLIEKLPGGAAQIDHINRDPLDNRKENLRLVDNRGNQWNRRDNSPHGPGVTEMKGKKKPFRARAYLGNQCFVLGQFPTPEAAREARDAFLALMGEKTLAGG